MSKEQTAERLERIRAAIALEPVGRIPYIAGGTAFNVVITGNTMHDYFDPARMDLNCTVNLEGCQQLHVDASQAPLFNAGQLSILWYSEVAVPGYDIPDGQLWQIEEKEMIFEKDYDEILEMGFPAWNLKFLTEHFGTPEELMGPMLAYTPTAVERFVEGGVVPLVGGAIASPFEMFCGGRTLMGMLTEDLYDYPEKLEQVFKQVHEVTLANNEAVFENPATRPLATWIGGWRGTPSTLSPDDFEKWSWSYMRDYYDLCMSYGVIPIFHLDSCWDRGLAYFNELERGTCVMGLDGQTDIKLAHEVCGDNCCIMGDVPASMLAFGTPEQTYDYALDLCKTFEGRGFLMSSGCDVPFNAKLDNVNMMLKAVDDYQALSM